MYHLLYLGPLDVPRSITKHQTSKKQHHLLQFCFLLSLSLFLAILSFLLQLGRKYDPKNDITLCNTFGHGQRNCYSTVLVGNKLYLWEQLNLKPQYCFLSRNLTANLRYSAKVRIFRSFKNKRLINIHKLYA